MTVRARQLALAAQIIAIRKSRIAPALSIALLVAPAEAKSLRLEQDIFGKDARVICDIYKRAYEAGRPTVPFVRCRVVRGPKP